MLPYNPFNVCRYLSFSICLTCVFSLVLTNISKRITTFIDGLKKKKKALGCVHLVHFLYNVYPFSALLISMPVSMYI